MSGLSLARLPGVGALFGRAHPATRIPHPFWTWSELARQRRALAALDAHLLNDIGLPRAMAERESARPVWDAPAHWSE